MKIGIANKQRFAPNGGKTLDANHVFAVIGLDGTIPTTPLPLDPLPSGWELSSALTWTAEISYSANGRNDKVSFGGMSDVWSPIQINFQGNIQGGILSLSISAPVRDVITGKEGVLPWTGVSSVIGLYPLPPTTVRQRLGDLAAQIIAYIETWPGRRFQQFNPDGSPYFGGPNGFGIMQLDYPPVTSGMIWSWMQNVDEGKRRFQAAQGIVANWYNKAVAATPSLPPLPADKLLRASFTYYNGGGGNGYYYVPTSDNTGWQPNPNPTGNTLFASALNYGDRAMSLLEAIQNGTLPSDWG
jgi:hypothetical protein